ncbi:MAG: membrane dipeptidase [Myxococcota bacterium]
MWGAPRRPRLATLLRARGCPRDRHLRPERAPRAAPARPAHPRPDLEPVRPLRQLLQRRRRRAHRRRPRARRRGPAAQHPRRPVHASRQTTLDVTAVTTPLLATHSDARRLRDVPRNLSDEELACIASTGGVVGVMFHAPFVADGPVDLARVADQVDALVAAAGIAHVGLGSDFDGDIQVPTGLADARQLPALWAELARRGYDEAALTALRGGNFRRALAAAQATR